MQTDIAEMPAEDPTTAVKPTVLDEMLSEDPASAEDPATAVKPAVVGRRGKPPMASYVRLKPLSADKEGSVPSEKRITQWDEAGSIQLSNGHVFDHAAAVLAPDETQARVYEVIAQPLVRSWLGATMQT